MLQSTNWQYLSYFLQKTEFDISCKLSAKESICIKCQILFFVKNKKLNMSACCLLKFLPSMQMIKEIRQYEKEVSESSLYSESHSSLTIRVSF